MRETRTVEFKEQMTNTFLKTVSAYANYGTGRILFGVNDEGLEVGIPNPAQACLDIENKINDSITPVPPFSLVINQHTGVVTLTVEEGLHKPYLYRAKAYRRADSATVEVDHLELSRLVLEGRNLSFENTQSSRQDLSFSYLADRFSEVLGIREMNDDILRTLELMNSDGSFNVAGELMADENPRPGIDMVRFGDSISILLDREVYDRRSILRQYDQACKNFRKYYLYEEIVGSRRVVRERIPEAAFREAIANALVHRQWDVDAQIRVSMFDDRVEVASPGGLPRGLSREEYLKGQISTLRSPILGNIFFRLHIIERFGTGVPRIRDAYSTSVTQPAFEVFENSVKVILPVTRSELGLPEDDELVYRLLVKRTMAISELTKRTGFGKTKVQGILKRLSQGGLVEVVGAGRGTRYSATQ